VELGERLRELRLQAGLTKTALAKPEYTVSYVSLIESGRRKPSSKAIEHLSRRLMVSPEYLTTGIPDGVQEDLRYKMEEARHQLRERQEGEAERTIRAVRARAEEYGLDGLRALSSAELGSVLLQTGRVREAIDAYEEALADQALPERDRGMAVAALGRAYRGVGDLTYAVELIESYLTKGARPPLDPSIIAELQTVLVSLYFERGDVFQAERAAGRALAAAALDVPDETRARTYWDASRVMAEHRRWDEALEYATRARLILEEGDDQRRVGRLHNAYAFICLDADPPRTAEAADHLDKAESLLLSAGASTELAYVLSERSRLALLEGQHQDALVNVERALAYVGTDELEMARCLFLRGRALGGLGRHGEARASLEEAAAAFTKHGARQQEAMCWGELGELHLAAGDVDGAVEALRAGLRALDPRRSRA
jgi:tetratricopeptide (TPR) repeat protein